MVGGDVFGGDGRAADHEQIHARVEHGRIVLLGALRRKRAGDGDAGVADLVQARCDELRFDRLGICLLHVRGGLVDRQFGNFGQDRLGVVVTGPQALKVEHAERAELAHRNRRARAGDRIHRCANHRDVEFVGVHLPRGRHILWVARTARRHNRDVVEPVCDAAFFSEADFNFLRHGSKANAPP